MTGIIFDIQRYSVHDGPGIRSLVFMKGCPLNCKWCSNPEGQKSYPETRFIATKCVGEEECRIPCVEICPEGAINTLKDGKPITDRALCRGCGKCVETCLYGARQLSGKSITVEALLKEILKDEAFYQNSGGGITLGGGEPLSQFEFAKEFLRECKGRTLHTAVETCGFVTWTQFEEILEFIDFFYYDIKVLSKERHRQLTGVSNSIILENARKLLSIGEAQVVIRIPVIPGYNDSDKNIGAIAKFVFEAGGDKIELLPYHRLGAAKYDQLDKEYGLKGVHEPNDELMQRLSYIVRSTGVKELYYNRISHSRE